jgi:BirA family biotin operon repressor/biotin-[acetyl-CoA-carboxylase] ligase
MIHACLKRFKELNSTNSYVLENFEKLNTGDVVITDVQTAGRGRFDRVWEGSSTQNIYMTFVIKVNENEQFPVVNVTQYLCVVLNRVLNRDYNISSTIKWPNDILYNGKKISGILAEGKILHDKFVGIALGVGINVNCDMSVFQEIPNAISIQTILGSQIDKEKFLKILTDEFFKGFEDFSKQGFAYIAEEYKQMCKFNKIIKISASANEGNYEFVRVNDDGTITVLDDTKKELKIVNGDIL